MSPARSSLTELEWEQLLKRIKDGKCTPFLGAGVNRGVLPLGSEIAEKWAVDFKYPLPDRHDLPRVSQYLALTGPERVFPKEKIYEMFEGVTPPDFATHPLGSLSGLPLPVFITTNYDDLMFRALRFRRKDPKLELCSWNRSLHSKAALQYSEAANGIWDSDATQVTGFGPTRFASRSFVPTVASPVVYHLHGHYKLLESMVLTENDYLDFLVNMSRDQKLLPSRIQEALTGASLLFMGYSLADYNFRVLFRGLIHPLAENRRLSVSIQLPQTEDAGAVEYLTKYFEDFKIRVYWGTAEEFAEELQTRWSRFSSPAQAAHVA
jgi:SIR2-like protein